MGNETVKSARLMSDTVQRRGRRVSKPAERQRTVRFTIRFTPVEADRIEEEARMLGETVSEMVRRMVLFPSPDAGMNNAFKTDRPSK